MDQKDLIKAERSRIYTEFLKWLDAAPLESTKTRYDGGDLLYIKIPAVRAALDEICLKEMED